MPRPVDRMLESEAMQKDIALIMGSIRAALCEAWLVGYKDGMAKSNSIWQSTVPDER